MIDDTDPAPPVLEGEVLVGPRKRGGGAHLAKTSWKPGQSGNPTGRPKGSKHKLSELFLADLQKWHAKHGMKAIEKVGREKPAELLKIIASIVPKQLDLDIQHGIQFQPIDLQEIERRTNELLSRIPHGDDSPVRQD